MIYEYSHFGYSCFGLFLWIILATLTFYMISSLLNRKKKCCNDSCECKKKVEKESSNEALTILKNRFAKGDILEEEYLSKKKILDK